MLSDSLRELRRRIAADQLPADRTGLMLELQAYEMEARNLETRVQFVTNQPHVPLDGLLVSGRVDLGRSV